MNNELSPEYTKALASLKKQGLQHKLISELLALAKLASVPSEDQLPFSVKCANQIMNGSTVSGMYNQAWNDYIASNIKEVSQVEGRHWIIDLFTSHPDLLLVCYNATKKTTLDKWRQAIELILMPETL